MKVTVALYRIVFLIIVFFQSSGVYAQVVVDANLNDWDTTKFQYDDKNKLSFDFKKDDQFLYIAIFKNENVGKIRAGGGIQLSFSSGDIGRTSFGIKFAHTIKRENALGFSAVGKEELELINVGDIASQIVPVFNEWGIQISWKRTDIRYTPTDGIISYEDRKKIPKDPNVFWAEIQIPLSFVRDKAGNIINYSICLSGADRNKEGEEGLIRRRLFENRNSNMDQEMYEKHYFTEYFGYIDLDSL